MTGVGEIGAVAATTSEEIGSSFRNVAQRFEKEMEELRDPASETKWERMAREKGLSYVKLDGNVGCCVNGAWCK